MTVDPTAHGGQDQPDAVTRPDPTARTVAELPPQQFGIWGPETVFCGGVRYGRLHGGPWHVQATRCDYWWGEWRCTREAHGAESKHDLEFIDCDGDVTVDPRLT